VLAKLLKKLEVAKE